MAEGINKVILVGNLGNKPELRHTQSGNAVCNFSLATTENYKKDGERQQKTEWHNIVVWGKVGENVAQYLDKGRSVYLEGKLQTRSYDDKDGNKKYTTEINASKVVFLGGGNGGSSGRSDEDVPF